MGYIEDLAKNTKEMFAKQDKEWEEMVEKNMVAIIDGCDCTSCTELRKRKSLEDVYLLLEKRVKELEDKAHQHHYNEKIPLPLIAGWVLPPVRVGW